MRVLVDTHTFIWALLHDHRLTTQAKATLRSEEHDLIFSLVSLWEIAIKIKTGKLNTIGSSVAYIRDEMNNYSMELLPIRYEHILHLEALPHHHSDPFDRLLIAQALSEGLPILTADRAFRQYGVKTIW
ncbi:MAG TPA: type II toxin-antitoxin system VapC family toxin [Edaphobacter sp.]|jgi:PIN domain nuclease of toxin-antitoxin system